MWDCDPQLLDSNACASSHNVELPEKVSRGASRGPLAWNRTFYPSGGYPTVKISQNLTLSDLISACFTSTLQIYLRGEKRQSKKNRKEESYFQGKNPPNQSCTPHTAVFHSCTISCSLLTRWHVFHLRNHRNACIFIALSLSVLS